MNRYTFFRPWRRACCLLAQRWAMLVALVAVSLGPVAAADYHTLHPLFGSESLSSRSITVDDGLPGNTINEMVQDGDGYIWLATNNGLSRYDAYATINYTSLNSPGQPRLEARVGRIVHDGRRHLLWMSTATYANACFDLSARRFVDWTARGENLRPQNKYYLSERGMFFYGQGTGVHLSAFADGQFCVTDYTMQGGQLPSDSVLMILEDSHGNTWMPTDRGVACLRADGSMRTVLQGVRIVGAVSHRDTTCFLSSAGDSYAFSASGHQLYHSHMQNGGLKPVERVNTGFVWHGRWMVFTPIGTCSMQLASGQWRAETGPASVTDGLNQGDCEGYHFVSNNSGRLWIYPDSGDVRVLNLLPNARFANNRGRRFHIVTDLQGRLFIATYGNGLFVWNPATDGLRHYTATEPSPLIASNYLLYALRDRQGAVWLGTEGTGACCLSITGASAPRCLLPEPTRQGDWANAIEAMAQHPDGHIIISTRESGLYQYQPATAALTRQTDSPWPVSVLACDPEQRLWTGCQNGVLQVDGLRYAPGEGAWPADVARVTALCADHRGRMWIGTWGGGLLCTPRDSLPVLQPRTYLTGNMNERRIKALAMSPSGILWIGTNNGLYRLDTNASAITAGSFTAYNTQNQRFGYDEIFTLFCTDDSTLWVGAAGSGILKCSVGGTAGLQTVSQTTTSQGLSNNNVYCIVADTLGYVWAGTESGVSRVNPRNGMAGSVQPLPIPQSNVATANCALQTSGGELLMGTMHGLLAIAPTLDGTPSLAGSAPSITDLRVNGVSTVFSQSAEADAAVTLEHDQNSLSIYFSSFNYANPQSALYQYYLEGAERSWRPMTTVNHADYPELRPGRYTFHLRSLGKDNEWLPEQRLALHIRSPWWATWWALLLYALLVVLASWYVYRNWKEKFNMHQQMKLDRQLMDFRTQLFTNITHEFRTPLAIIKGAVDKLEQKTEAVQTAQRGVKRMLRLVNQFMEYRKASTNNLHLQVAEADLVSFVRAIYQDFWAMAQQKSLHLSLTPFARECNICFDADVVETVVCNLLSNAIKYTPENGTVAVRIRRSDGTVSIDCEDSGPGMTAQQQAVLFQPFMKGLTNQGGMGIGLYTSHIMAQLHHGSLTYQQASGGGSLFTFSLPADYDYADDERRADAVSPLHSATGETPQDDVVRELLPEALNDVTIAIIEDDPDMMHQIRTEMGTVFRTTTYMNGRSGFEGVKAAPPALVICDAMLPDMNGYDIVAQLKADAQTRHIPIIMLTALNDEQHQIRAYKAGADDYMTKPCNFRLLVARAVQLIAWGQSRAAASVAEAEPTVDAAPAPLLTSQADKLFLDKLQLFTAQHLADSGFSIDQLAQLMAMGRTKFYGRVKELTGVSPNKYLMNLRMEKAAQLLADGELTVAEVSYRVGMQDASYFNKCFKAHFGVVPSKYVRPAAN